MRKRIVSVLVPTKNRYKYLKHLINLVESFDDSRIELLIQDNSDDNTEIISFIDGKSFVSTVYFHSSEVLSMGQNTDYAIRNSVGKYLCFIGDDDAVCRNIADCAEWMEKNDVDALRPTYLQYLWNEKDGEVNSGWMLYDTIDGKYSLLNPEEELKTVLKQGVPNFRKMAKFYHGIVKREIIEKVLSIGGTCCPGPTPDMSSAVSIAFFIKKYAYVNLPVIIPGMSKMVGGGVMGKVLRLEDVGFISQSVRDNWDKGFPRLWATELIWPECSLKALEYVSHPEFKSFYNKNKTLSRLVIMHCSYFKEAYQHSDKKLSFLTTFITYFLTEGIVYLFRKVKGKLNHKYNGDFTITQGLGVIENAEAKLMKLSYRYSFNNLIKQ